MLLYTVLTHTQILYNYSTRESGGMFNTFNGRRHFQPAIYGPIHGGQLLHGKSYTWEESHNNNTGNLSKWAIASPTEECQWADIRRSFDSTTRTTGFHMSVNRISEPLDFKNAVVWQLWQCIYVDRIGQALRRGNLVPPTPYSSTSHLSDDLGMTRS